MPFIIKSLDYLKSFFITILVILLFRSLCINYYLIPSGSMYPNYEVGDYIFVNRLAYGTHIPFTNTNIVNWSEPKRGDIVVFNSPSDTVMVKRVIGIGGDKVEIKNNRLIINDIPVQYNEFSDNYPNDPSFPLKDKQLPLLENINGKEHLILTLPKNDVITHYPDYFKNHWQDNIFFVDKNQVLLLGDNRDNSLDSRFWGTLSTDKIIGKVFSKI